MKRFLLSTTLLLLFALQTQVCGAPSFKSASIAIYDVDSKTFIVKKNIQSRRAPASTIKVLSALTAIDLSKDLRKWVRVSKRASRMEPTRAGLVPGEEYRIIDLICTILIASCNDAASALAEGLSGSESIFAQEMQKKANALGLKNTRVTNASGLPKPRGMLSTCEDSVLMIQALMKNPLLASIMARKKFDLVSRKGRKTKLSSHNRLLSGYAYPVRGKTGYTILAKHCFLSWAKFKGRTIVVSVLGAPKKEVLWKELQKAYDYSFNQTKASLPRYMRRHHLSLKKLHQALGQAQFPLAKTEKHYGALTRQKVIEFQKSMGLEPDGLVGPKTWGALSQDP